MNTLDIKFAYISAFIFLNNIYNAKKIENIGSLLGDMQLFEDDSSVDPAAVEDWRIAVYSVKGVAAEKQSELFFLTKIEAYEAFCKFLKDYSSRTSSQDINELVNNLVQSKTHSTKKDLFIEWSKVVDFVEKNPKDAREIIAFNLL